MKKSKTCPKLLKGNPDYVDAVDKISEKCSSLIQELKKYRK